MPLRSGLQLGSDGAAAEDGKGVEETDLSFAAPSPEEMDAFRDAIKGMIEEVSKAQSIITPGSSEPILFEATNHMPSEERGLLTSLMDPGQPIEDIVTTALLGRLLEKFEIACGRYSTQFAAKTVAELKLKMLLS